jgi:hypothetical protein
VDDLTIASFARRDGLRRVHNDSMTDHFPRISVGVARLIAFVSIATPS